MIRLVRAEWTKLFTTKVWIGLLLGACLMVTGFAVLLHRVRRQPGEPASRRSGTRSLRGAGPGHRGERQRALPDPRHHRDDAGVPAPDGDADLPDHAPAGPGGRGQAGRLRARRPCRWRWSCWRSTTWSCAIHAGARGAAPALNADNLERAGQVRARPGDLRGDRRGHRAHCCATRSAPIVGGLVYLFVVEPIIRSDPGDGRRLQVDARRRARGADRDVRGPELLDAWQGGLLLLGYGLLAALPGHVVPSPSGVM